MSDTSAGSLSHLLATANVWKTRKSFKIHEWVIYWLVLCRRTGTHFQDWIKVFIMYMRPIKHIEFIPFIIKHLQMFLSPGWAVVMTMMTLFLTDDEGSGSDAGKKFTKCSTCKYGAECDEDSEDVWWVFHFLWWDVTKYIYLELYRFKVLVFFPSCRSTSSPLHLNFVLFISLHSIDRFSKFAN